MPSALAKVLRDQRDLLLFRSIKPDLEHHEKLYFAWGFFTTWLAGIGRYWDHPNAAWWQYAGLGSIGYVFVMALLVWGTAALLKPANWSYRNVLLFVTFTSLPAVLYAIPVEKFLSIGAAQTANVIFLAVVAAWRVALLMRYLLTAARLSPSETMVAGLLPLALIVTLLVVLNLEKAVFEIMGGNMQPTQNDAAYAVLFLISLLSIVASPILLVAYAVLTARAQRRGPAQ